MNRLPALLGGVFGLVLFSWLGLVFIPQMQLRALGPLVNEETSEVYPVNAGGLVEAGRRVYAELGCASCHTQQVRPAHATTDIARQWGSRVSVARDYLYEQPVLLGTLRIGPDLANIGARKDETREDAYTAEWHYRHLYNPRSVSPDSVMPPFRFLFRERKIVGEPSAQAVPVDANVKPGYEIVPSSDAVALVAYLRSLNRNYPLPEGGPVTQPQPASPEGAQ